MHDGDTAWQAMHRTILDQANALFTERGYGGTAVKDLAERCGCSVGYLYKHFTGKQQILDVLLAEHLDVIEKVRSTVRSDPDRPALACLAAELEQICRHLVAHRGLIPVYVQRELEATPETHERLVRLRRQDAEFLERARLRGELPDLDTGLLAATVNGAVEGLLKHLARDGDDDAFLRIPRVIDEIILEPLRRRAPAGNRPRQD